MNVEVFSHSELHCGIKGAHKKYLILRVNIL
jgi:hypothetical protein